MSGILWIDMPKKNYVSTGIQTIDEALGGGYARGGMTFVDSRPQQGKTSFVLSAVWYAALKKKKVWYLSELSFDGFCRRAEKACAVDAARKVKVPAQGTDPRRVIGAALDEGADLLVIDSPLVLEQVDLNEMLGVVRTAVVVTRQLAPQASTEAALTRILLSDGCINLPSGTPFPYRIDADQKVHIVNATSRYERVLL